MRAFLESLDTIRFSLPSIARESNARAHAETEVLLNLLFGNTIVLSEPQCFDSLGSVYILSDMLEKRRFGTSRAGSFPTVTVALMDEPGRGTCREMVCSRLLDEKRIVSGFPDIGMDMEARVAYAECVRSRSSLGLPGCIPPEFLERLDLLLTHLDSGVTTRAGTPRITLPDLANWLADPTFPGSVVPSDVDSAALERLSSGVKLLQGRGIAFQYRSELLDLELGSAGLDQEIFEAILAYICSCYNVVVADSVQAELSVLSSESGGAKPLIGLAEALAACAPFPGGTGEVGSLYVSVGQSEDAVGQAEGIRWDDVWSILSEQRWKASVAFLRRAMAAATGNAEDRDAVNDAFDQHVDLLSEMLEPAWAEIRSEGNYAVLKRNIARAARDMLVPSIVSYFFTPIGPPGLLAGLAADTAFRTVREYRTAWNTSGSVRKTLAQTADLRETSFLRMAD